MTAQTIGRRVGSRYMIRRALGYGGICTVYEGVHLYTSRRVAVKILNDEYKGHDEARLRLLDEARALGIVRHPNVVEIHDAGTWENAPYVIMEMLEGRNLEGLLTSRGRMHPTDALQVIRQVALGLGAAHRAGVVHRDVKPGNIHIVRAPAGREKATLLDFGVARLPRGADKASQRFGHAGTVVGTPEYMAPEQAFGRVDLDGRADLYALGAVLWECLTESVPIAGTYDEVVAFHANAAPPSLRRVRPELPPALLDLVDRCLQRDPRARFPDAQALVNAIDATGLCRGVTNLIDNNMSLSAVEAPAPVVSIPAAEPRPAPAQSPHEASWRRVRALARAPFSAPVRVVVDGEIVDVRGEDVAEAGLLAIGPAGFVVGDSVQLRFALPTTGDVVTTQAVVRWVRGRNGSSRAASAIGFEFVDAPYPVRGALASYVALMLQG